MKTNGLTVDMAWAILNDGELNLSERQRSRIRALAAQEDQRSEAEKEAGQVTAGSVSSSSTRSNPFESSDHPTEQSADDLLRECGRKFQRLMDDVVRYRDKPRHELESSVNGLSAMALEAIDAHLNRKESFSQIDDSQDYTYVKTFIYEDADIENVKRLDKIAEENERFSRKEA